MLIKIAFGRELWRDLELVDLLGNLGQVIFAGDGGGKFQNPKAGFFIVGLLLFKLLSLFSR